MFKCEDCNANLLLIVENTQYSSYKTKDDGSLEFIESDGYGEEVYLECVDCGQTYEFDNNLMTVIEMPKLDWFGRGKLDLADVGIKRKND